MELCSHCFMGRVDYSGVKPYKLNGTFQDCPWCGGNGVLFTKAECLGFNSAMVREIQKELRLIIGKECPATERIGLLMKYTDELI